MLYSWLFAFSSKPVLPQRPPNLGPAFDSQSGGGTFEDHERFIVQPERESLRRENRACGSNWRADVGRPLGLAVEVDGVDRAGIVAKVYDVVFADNGRRFDRCRGAIFPADFVTVAVDADQQTARLHASRGLTDADVEMAVAVGYRCAEHLARHLRLPSQRAAGSDAVKTFVLTGNDDGPVGGNQRGGTDDADVALIGCVVPTIRAFVAAEIDGE